MNDREILSRNVIQDNACTSDFSGRDVIAVFARAPIFGRVKSRLAKKLGAEKARQIYAAMLRDCLGLAQRAASETKGVLVCYTPPDAFDNHANSLTPFWNGARLPQCDGNLSARLLDCFSHLKNCGAQKILIIGSDSPDLPEEYLCAAFKALDSHVLVFGPAQDGGFYLIGAHEISPALFKNVTWSSEDTLATILANAARCKGSTFLLPFWRDVDEIEDLHALISRLKLNPNAAPNTRGVLQSAHNLK